MLFFGFLFNMTLLVVVLKTLPTYTAGGGGDEPPSKNNLYPHHNQQEKPSRVTVSVPNGTILNHHNRVDHPDMSNTHFIGNSNVNKRNETPSSNGPQSKFEIVSAGAPLAIIGFMLAGIFFVVSIIVIIWFCKIRRQQQVNRQQQARSRFYRGNSSGIVLHCAMPGHIVMVPGDENENTARTEATNASPSDAARVIYVHRSARKLETPPPDYNEAVKQGATPEDLPSPPPSPGK